MSIVQKIILEGSSNDRKEYLFWKKKNVTLRGIKEVNKENGVHGMLGKGLYTCPLSNRSMASQYGKLHFVVNARPKKPIVFNGINDWEIWKYRLIHDILKYDRESDFNTKTDINTEIMKLGYDGVEIKGREMVNYHPENVVYFKDEGQLFSYWQVTVKNKRDI